MSRTIRFIIFLVLGLALATIAAAVIVRQTTRAWFENDLYLRANLVVTGARRALVAGWNENDPQALQRILTELTNDERLLAAGACSPDLVPLAQTELFPANLSCAELGAHVRPSRDTPPSEWRTYARVQSLASGEVHVSAIPVFDQEQPLGFVVIVHDLAFLERRDAAATRFLLVAFGILALAASAITLIASRLSWRNWSNEIRRFLSAGTQRKEFLPILSDVRELVDRLLDQEGRAWTPQRLKETLVQQLDGEKIVILANREPYVHQRAPDGGVETMHPASGLVTALEPVVRACSGTWIAHGAGSADRETADRHGRLLVPPDERSYTLRRVWLSPEEEQGYYYGFANEGLWPLCHIAHARPIFRGDDWEKYRAVNEKFVAALLEEVDSKEPIVLVQDYHFALAPRLIRERLPRATVIMFWHIPWPNSENFGICPWRHDVLQGMLGASILGFHTQFHCNNFLDSVDRFLEARIDREQNAVVQQGWRTLVRPYPISVEWPMRGLESIPPASTCRESVFAELELAPDVRLGVGVDRLDYTKGIEERFLSVERLFERHPEHIGRFTFVQLAAPSRTVIERYRALNASIEELATRINVRFGRDGWQPIVLLRAHHEPPTVYRYLRAADLCYVSSLHDGMNLVAKEFIAARDDEHGVLVLSQFTGAARELTEALVVNPYDLDEAADALHAALRMREAEQRARMRAMRSLVAEFNVYRWAGRMLRDAARLRRQDKLAGRLSDPLLRTAGAAR